MNKQLTARNIFIILCALVFTTTACVKDKCTESRHYTFYTPVYKAKAEVTGNIKSNAPRALENTGKIYIFDKYIFLNEVDKGIHIIDNSVPSNPRNIGFVDIPGNMDMAVKGNILYADLYGDLVALDISDPKNVKLVKLIEGMFPERMWANGIAMNGSEVVVDWIETDTTVQVSCVNPEAIFVSRLDAFFMASASSSTKSISPIGVGGSMARFTIVNDYLYTVDRHSLTCFNISNGDPVKDHQLYAGWDIETIYPFKNNLFIGSMGGMFIYDITNPAVPVKKSEFVHARACDPVIADDKYAYITLRQGTGCGPALNELLIVDIKDIQSPSLVKSYPMSRPHGLAKDGNLLLICDGEAGLKAFNASDPNKITEVSKVDNLNAYDVIAMNNIALVVARDGIYQYDYANPANIRLLSKIQVGE